MKRRQKIARWTAAVAALILAFFYLEIRQWNFTLLTSDTARLVCEAIFVANRPELLVREQELHQPAGPGFYRRYVTITIDRADKSVSGNIWGHFSRKAIFRRGIGCTTDEGVAESVLRAQGEGVNTALPSPDPARQWPEGEATLVGHLPPGIDAKKLNAAVDDSFAEPEPDKPRGTRGVVVIYRGRIVAERYAHGFTKDTPQLSYSMAKSLTNALVGVLVREGKLSLDAPAPVAEWHKKGDPHGAITLAELLHMTSGLQFEENYVSPSSDVAQQYVHGDLAGYAAAKPLLHPPGTYWDYSTGTANIVGRIVRETAGPDYAQGFAFPRRELFDPIGMRSAVLEVDGKGNFVGGTFAYATPRDFARLALLYLRDGIWNGRRILPEGWVAYSHTPVHAENTPDSGYGAFFWLNLTPDRNDGDLPPDTYEMNGYAGQSVFIIPSRDAAIVRLGVSQFGTWRSGKFAHAVLSALPAP